MENLMNRLATLALCFAMALPTASDAVWHHERSTGVSRDHHGRIARDPRARADFKRSHPCPSTGKTRGACPGFVIDHVRALCVGGADSPENMQYQSVAAGRAKDAWECAK
jgi:hypothetical protein